ncbi:MAG: hypothetical protein QHH02_05370 [Syntrophomonadaceae bacterium]|nr:hypothetical protein [Syntrophomonadaceae bacterium]
MKGLLKGYKLSAKRHFFPGFLLTTALLFFLPLTASARLSVSSPEGTLDGAQLVVVGEVAERDYRDTKRRVVVRVDEVIKGTYGKERLTLEMDQNPIYGWAGFDFPEPGAKVFLLLRGEEQCGYWLARDLNCVAGVNEGRVTGLYNGRKIGINESSWTAEDYARAYDEAYQAWQVQSKYRAVFRIGEGWYYANGRCLSMVQFKGLGT